MNYSRQPAESSRSYNPVEAGSSSLYESQANELNHNNEIIASVVQLKAHTRCKNTSRVYNSRQRRFLVCLQ